MRIERFCNYAGVVEQALAYYEKNPPKFTFEPHRGEIDADMVLIRDDTDELTVVSIFQDWTVVSYATTAVHFWLCAEEIIGLAKEWVPRDRLDLYREIEMTVHEGKINTFYPIDAYNDALTMKIKGIPGWAAFYNALHGDPHSLAPEQWLAGMISNGIEHARLHYEGWLHPSRSTADVIALMVKMVVWMASDDFDVKELNTAKRRHVLKRAEALMDQRDDASRKEGEAIHDDLLEVLGVMDPFWITWRGFGMNRGWWR